MEAKQMERRIICPEGWKAIHFPAHVVTDPKRFVFCSGMVSKDENDNVAHVGDIVGQCNKALDNVEATLHEAGMDLSKVVRMNYYTTDVQAFITKAERVIGERLTKAGCKPSSTLLGVTALANPDFIIEIEAIAAD